MVRTYRHLPKDLRDIIGRREYREYARFYGAYITEDGKRKRFSFQVNTSRTPIYTKHNGMVATVQLILRKRLPVHRQGQVFNGFPELLFGGTRWVKVKKILHYKAGMTYEA